MTDGREGNKRIRQTFDSFQAHPPLSFLLLFTEHTALGHPGLVWRSRAAVGPGRGGDGPRRQRPDECSQDGRAPQELARTDAEGTSPVDGFSTADGSLHGGWDEANQTTWGSGLAIPSKGEGGHPSTQRPLHSRPEEPSSRATCTHTGAFVAVCSPHPNGAGKWVNQPLCIPAMGCYTEPIYRCNFK